jgi:uncharacterized protein (TIGR01777 family)
MRVIITGGTGLIGRALTRSLSNHGYEIILLSRAPERARDLPQGTRAERWDGRTAAGWGTLANGAEAIVNLAGENIAGGRWTPERKRRIRESRIHAGQAVVEAVQEAAEKPRVVIQASGLGYYGCREEETITEETPPGDDFLAEVAIEWEASTAPVEARGVRRAVIRTAPVLSTEDGAFPRMIRPFRFFVGGPLGNGEQWFPWIHIADEVGAIRFLMKNSAAQGPFNLTAPNPLRNADFARALGRVLRRPASLPTPAFALRLLFGEMASVLLGGQRALPKRLLDLGFSFRFPEAESAMKDLLQ